MVGAGFDRSEGFGEVEAERLFGEYGLAGPGGRDDLGRVLRMRSGQYDRIDGRVRKQLGVIVHQGDPMRLGERGSLRRGTRSASGELDQ